MVLALATPFQQIFACTLMDGEYRACCCDEDNAMDDGCPLGGGCPGDTAGLVPTMDCCEISHQAVPGMEALSTDPASQLLLLLDAPQPPPVAVMPAGAEPQPFGRSPFEPPYLPARVSGTDTYFLTHRLRV
ncbi:MAG: hypothetical protein U5S82_14900 [Gammaproteobacteria bacterium]|nr:hypothetical protein [Gammaproteobacteria bacterium]